MRISWSVGSETLFGHVPRVGVEPSTSCVNDDPLGQAGRHFHCYMLDESICHSRAVWSILSLLFCFDGKAC